MKPSTQLPPARPSRWRAWLSATHSLTRWAGGAAVLYAVVAALCSGALLVAEPTVFHVVLLATSIAIVVLFVSLIVENEVRRARLHRADAADEDAGPQSVQTARGPRAGVASHA